MAAKTLDPIDILLELGIDLDDLSEQDYLSALMEAIATIEFQTKGKGDERSATLREEVIKIRKGKRKPQAKRTKISADSLKSAPKLTAKTTKLSPQKLLPGTAESQVAEETEPEQASIIKILTDISESVKSILYSLKASNNISKNLADDERKRRESKKRTGAESKLEKKRFEGLKKLGEKLIQPVKGPLEKLFNFIKTIILGKILLGILDWLGDPENQKKLESLIRFFKDWWPTIVTAVLLFGTGLGGLLKSIVGITFRFIPKLLGLLPGLLRFLKSPMGRLATLGVSALGLAGRVNDGGEDDVDLTKQDPAPAQTAPNTTQMVAGQEYDPNNPTEMQQKALDLKDQIQAKDGGLVPGGGPNKDTVPAMLAPGEFVMSRGAVQKYGSGTLASMNAAGGGTNRPIKKNGVTYAVGGGDIGDGRDRTEPKTTNVGDSIIAGAKKIIGTGRGIADQCAITTRAALKAAGHPAANKVTAIGDLDTPKGTAYSAPSFAASFGGTDMGKIITQKSQIKKGDMLLWRADRDKGGIINKGAITHVGIAADDGLKHQYDHNTSRGFHYRPHWHSSAGTSWFAGVRLGGSGGMAPPEIGESVGDQSGGGGGAIEPGDPRTSASSTGASASTASSGGEPATKSQSVLALKNGIQGVLNKLTGKFMPKKFTESEKQRYIQRGGEIKESTGLDVPGATADRQLGLLNPGEYVIPTDSVNKLGGPSFFDRLVATTDSNSTPAKLGLGSVDLPMIDPPVPMQPFINLIPTQTGGSKGYSDSSGSDLPNFDAGFGDPNKSKILGVVR